MANDRWRAVLKTAAFLRPYKLAIGFSLLALFVTAGITLSIGQGIRLLVDQGFATQSPELLAQYVLIFIGLVVLLAIGTFTRYYWVTWLGERVVADIRRAVFAHLIELHPGFFETNRSLEIQSRLTTDMTLLQSVVGSSASVALRNLIMLIGGVILLFVTNSKLALIVVLSIPLVVVPILLFGRRVRALSRQSQDKVAVVGAYVGEMLGQIKTVQAYNHQAADKILFDQYVEEAFHIARHRTLQRAWLVAVVIVLVFGAIGMMLWVGGMDVIAGKISGGELAAFIFYSIISGSAVGSVSEVLGDLQRAAGAAERTIELLEEPCQISSPVDPVQLPVVRGNIVFQEVCFTYSSRPELQVIDHFSLAIRPGETLALVGLSGAGKSTLFDLLLRFYDVRSGSIKLEGVDIRALNLSDLRRSFALVSQNPALFHGSIEQNLRYANPEATHEDIIAAAKAAFIHDFIVSLPQGYQTNLGDSGLGVSGGQRQRLAIARAILADAPILLLDEATSALDGQSENKVQQALVKLSAQRTTLVIAHRLSTVVASDRIALIHQGRLAGLGSHTELMQSSDLYQRLATAKFQTTT